MIEKANSDIEKLLNENKVLRLKTSDYLLRVLRLLKPEKQVIFTAKNIQYIDKNAPL